MLPIVKFTPGARKDLRSIHDYISSHDSPAKANYVAKKIVEAALSLRELPRPRGLPSRTACHRETGLSAGILQALPNSL